MLTHDIDRPSGRGHYNIAVLGPPWTPVSSESDDLECAISLLCGGRRGHRVTLKSRPEAAGRRLVQLYIIVDPGGRAPVSDQIFVGTKDGQDQENS